MKKSEELLQMILQAKSVNALKKIAPAPEILLLLNKAFDPFVLTVGTYELLFKAVKAIRASWPKSDGPFVSEQAEYCFYLTKLDGKLRNALLGLTTDIIRDEGKAKEWRKGIAQKVHPDKIGGDPRPYQALENLYAEITFKDESDE